MMQKSLRNFRCELTTVSELHHRSWAYSLPRPFAPGLEMIVWTDTASPDFCHTCTDLGSCFKHRYYGDQIAAFINSRLSYAYDYICSWSRQHPRRILNVRTDGIFRLLNSDCVIVMQVDVATHTPEGLRRSNKAHKNRFLENTSLINCCQEFIMRLVSCFSSLKHWCHNCPSSPQEPAIFFFCRRFMYR